MAACSDKKVSVEESEAGHWEKIETPEERLVDKIGEVVTLSNAHTLNAYVDLTVEKQNHLEHIKYKLD